MNLAKAIGNNLRAHRSLLMHETRLHDVIAAALTDAGIFYDQEYRLSAADRADFYIPAQSIVIEIKKGNAGLSDLPQIGRYLKHDCVHSVLVIAMRITELPDQFQGKPVEHLALWKYLL